MADKAERIKQLLGSGLSSETVAGAVGVDQSYISNLLKDEDFYHQVQEARASVLTARTTRDLTIDELEDKLIIHLDDMIERGGFSKPEQVLSAFRVVNAAHRRGTAPKPSTASSGKVINLQIPIAVKTYIGVNSKGEVIEIDGKTMVTMQSQELVKKISELKGEDSEGVFNKLGKAIQKVG